MSEKPMPEPTGDDWIKPVLDMIRTQRDERLAVTAVCLALAGDDPQEAEVRLTRVADVLAWADGELGPSDARRKQTKAQRIARRARGMIETARADLAQLREVADA